VRLLSGEHFGQISIHKDLEAVSKAQDNNCFLWLLVRNKSHFMQPLDDVPFATLKVKFRIKAKEISDEAAFANDDGDDLLFEALYDGERETFQGPTIQEKFLFLRSFNRSRDTISHTISLGPPLGRQLILQ